MPEDRSDEQATTKVFPYPIPSPERDKVEEIQPVCVWCDHVLACDHCGTEQPYDDLSVLKAALALSEKRAEEAEGKLSAERRGWQK